MIGAKVSGYTLAVGDYVFVTLDGQGVQRARIASLVVSTWGLSLEVRTQGGTSHIVKTCKVYTNPVDAANHAFTACPEIAL